MDVPFMARAQLLAACKRQGVAYYDLPPAGQESGWKVVAR